MIWFVVIPADTAAEAEALLVEQALNLLESMPAKLSMARIHLVIDDDEIGLCGLM